MTSAAVTFSRTYLAVDLRRSLRNRRTLLFLVVMPVLFFVMFGGSYRDNNDAYSYIMVSMAVYGAMIATTSTGASVATERALGWTRTLRLTPLRPAGYVLTKVLSALVLGAVPVALVLAYGAATGAHLTAAQWLGCGLAAWLCSLTFAAFGLLMGYLVPAENVMQFLGPVLALLSFFGGLFVPLDQLPSALRDIAPWTPVYPVGQIARSPITHDGFTVEHVAVLLVWTALLAVGTALLFRRDTSRV